MCESLSLCVCVCGNTCDVRQKQIKEHKFDVAMNSERAKKVAYKTCSTFLLIAFQLVTQPILLHSHNRIVLHSLLIISSVLLTPHVFTFG